LTEVSESLKKLEEGKDTVVNFKELPIEDIRLIPALMKSVPVGV
jgi:hypothetical protein